MKQHSLKKIEHLNEEKGGVKYKQTNKRNKTIQT